MKERKLAGKVASRNPKKARKFPRVNVEWRMRPKFQARYQLVSDQNWTLYGDDFRALRQAEAKEALRKLRFGTAAVAYVRSGNQRVRLFEFRLREVAA